MLSKVFTLIAALWIQFVFAAHSYEQNREVERYTSAAFMYMDLHDYETAKYMAQTAVGLADEVGGSYTTANAFATLGVAFIKQNPDALPGMELNINRALRYYNGIGEKTDLDRFIIKNLELVVESSFNNTPVKLSNELLDSLRVKRFSDRYYDLRSDFVADKKMIFLQVTQKLTFASQLSRHTLPLPNFLHDALSDKAVSTAQLTGDPELIARAHGNAGLHFASYNDPKTHYIPSPNYMTL